MAPIISSSSSRLFSSAILLNSSCRLKLEFGFNITSCTKLQWLHVTVSFPERLVVFTIKNFPHSPHLNLKRFFSIFVVSKLNNRKLSEPEGIEDVACGDTYSYVSRLRTVVGLECDGHFVVMYLSMEMIVVNQQTVCLVRVGGIDGFPVDGGACEPETGIVAA